MEDHRSKPPILAFWEYGSTGKLKFLIAASFFPGCLGGLAGWFLDNLPYVVPHSWLWPFVGAGIGTFIGFVPALTLIMAVSIYEWFRLK